MSENFDLHSEFAEKVASQVRDAIEGKRKVSPQTSMVEAWLSLALFYGDSPLTIGEIINIADGINHAYPKAEEVAWTFLRLKNRGWLTVQGELYGLTPKGRSGIQVIVNEGTVLERVDKLKDWLVANPPPNNK